MGEIMVAKVRKKDRVTIKGNQEGLVFVLDDSCPFDDLLKELKQKLFFSHVQILSGPLVHVHVKLGNRQISDEDRKILLELFGQKGNLLIKSFETEGRIDRIDPFPDRPKMMKGLVRSGQTVRFDGNLLWVGDVNPGGTIISTGDIYILGSLKGTAHAGCDGGEAAIIAAAHFKPTQLRIADVVSRPPDEWGFEEAHNEFAYLDNRKMKIDKIVHLRKIRPEANVWKGV